MSMAHWQSTVPRLLARETDHSMGPQFPQVEVHQPTSKTPVAPGFTCLQDEKHLTIATSFVLNGVVFRYLFLA